MRNLCSNRRAEAGDECRGTLPHVEAARDVISRQASGVLSYPALNPDDSLVEI